MLSVSSRIPRKINDVAGPSTFSSFNGRPRFFLHVAVIAWRFFLHSLDRVDPIVKKSSK